jgi:hypothetical protein
VVATVPVTLVVQALSETQVPLTATLPTTQGTQARRILPTTTRETAETPTQLETRGLDPSHTLPTVQASH